MSRDVACPSCGTLFNPIAVPDVSIGRLLSSMIEDGASADVAADKVIDTFPPGVGSFIRPTVRAEAQRIARGRDRQVEKATIGSDDRWAAKSAQMRARLLATTFALGDGVVVTWGEATDEQFQIRHALLDKHVEGTRATQERIRRARSLLRETGARCLNEIDADRVLAVLDEASACVPTPARGLQTRDSANAADVIEGSGSVREPASRANGRSRKRPAVPGTAAA